MAQIQDYEELTRNTRRVEFNDGLQDFQNAAVFLILGLLGGLFLSPQGMEFYARAWFLERELTAIAFIGLIALFVLIAFGMRRFMRWIRLRYLWPSEGRIEPLKWQVSRSASVIGGVVWLMVFFFGLALVQRTEMDLDAGMRVVIGASGVGTGVLYFLLGRELGLTRYRWVGVTGALVSLAMLFLPLKASMSWILFGIQWSLILLVSGASALRKALTQLRSGVHG